MAKKKVEVKMTSYLWAQNKHILVLDPDGWDRTDYRKSWFEEEITEEEFDKRAMKSTCQGLPKIDVPKPGGEKDAT